MILIHDSMNLLSAADVQSLEAAAGRWPFDVHLVVAETSNKSAMDAKVHAEVNGPNVVAIGLDPTHHHTVVHFGTGTAVPRSSWPEISAAGNASFKSSDQGHFAAGIVKIADAAQASRATSATSVPDVATPSTAPSGHVAVVLLVVVALFAVGAIVLAWWRSRKSAERFEAKASELDAEIEEKRARNQEEAAWGDEYRRSVGRTKRAGQVRSVDPSPTRSVAQQSTVVVNQGGGGSGDLLTGYLIGRQSAPTIVERPMAPMAPMTSSYDAGGSSSSYGSSDDSSSSYDAGGSDSSYSDSSSSDSGSSDSGGGSSDW